jgi:hypothetical protein
MIKIYYLLIAMEVRLMVEFLVGLVIAIISSSLSAILLAFRGNLW